MWLKDILIILIIVPKVLVLNLFKVDNKIGKICNIWIIFFLKLIQINKSKMNKMALLTHMCATFQFRWDQLRAFSASPSFFHLFYFILLCVHTCWAFTSNIDYSSNEYTVKVVSSSAHWWRWLEKEWKRKKN